MSVVFGMGSKRSSNWRTGQVWLVMSYTASPRGRMGYIPSFAVFAFANDDKTVLLLVTKSTSCCEFLSHSQHHRSHLPMSHVTVRNAHFSSRYSSPKLINA